MMPWWQWKANWLNSFFDTFGPKDKHGRGGSSSNIRPETVRHGETKDWPKE